MADPNQHQADPADSTNPILILPNSLAVRPHTHADAPSIAHHANNKKIARNMTTRWPHPYTLDKAHDWIATTRNPENWVATGPTDPNSNNATGLGLKMPLAYLITMEDQVVGGIGITFQNDAEFRTAGFGYWVGEEHWGKGIMSVVLPAWIEWVWKTYPWIVKLQPNTFGWNPASGRVLEKAGFKLEGTMRCAIERFGVLGDMKVYGLIREGYEASNEPPVAN